MSGSAIVLGVIHLLPLPGSPRFGGNRAAILEHARRDAAALLSGGVAGFIIENFGDAPFNKDRAGDSVVAEMAVITAALRALAGDDPHIGVNVLRNDAPAALAIAAATGASFIRVNVHTGVMFTDQGVVEGDAATTLRVRKQLESSVEIWADIAVKHAIPPPGFELASAARDCAYRGLADALIVTGSATGNAVDPEALRIAREAVPDRPLYIGSGATPLNATALLRIADGVIAGTSLKRDGRIENPVDPARVRALVNAAAAAHK